MLRPNLFWSGNDYGMRQLKLLRAGSGSSVWPYRLPISICDVQGRRFYRFWFQFRDNPGSSPPVAELAIAS